MNQNIELGQSDLVHLAEDGYSSAEISEAFDWLLRTDAPYQQARGYVPGSIRVLHPSERRMFSTDAWGMLQRYILNEVITNSELEDVIDAARLEYEGPVDCAGIFELISLVLGRRGGSLLGRQMPTV